MKVHELPEEVKAYTLLLSNGQSFDITGNEKVTIMATKSQFIELRTGEVINKSFITSISLDKDKTKSNYLALPEKKQLAIVESI